MRWTEHVARRTVLAGIYIYIYSYETTRRRRCKDYIEMDSDSVLFSQDSDWLWARQQGFHSWQSGTFPVCQNVKAKSLGPPVLLPNAFLELFPSD
jgi:hypothetical protein